MKLQVDRSIAGVVCVQLGLEDCFALAGELRALQRNTRAPLRIDARGEWVSFEVNAESFRVEVHSDGLRFRMPPANLRELIEAVEEYVEEDSELPLDHSLEAFGAEIVGPCVTDVVIETVASGVTAEDRAEDPAVDSVQDLLKTGRKLEAIALLRRDRRISLLDATKEAERIESEI